MVTDRLQVAMLESHATTTAGFTNYSRCLIATTLDSYRREIYLFLIRPSLLALGCLISRPSAHYTRPCAVDWEDSNDQMKTTLALPAWQNTRGSAPRLP